jgi:hypothetical protein
LAQRRAQKVRAGGLKWATGEVFSRRRDSLSVRVMQLFTVVLEVRWNGSACGTTEDVIEAETADEAIEKARTQWKRVEPSFSFHPLLVIAV